MPEHSTYFLLRAESLACREDRSLGFHRTRRMLERHVSWVHTRRNLMLSGAMLGQHLYPAA